MRLLSATRRHAAGLRTPAASAAGLSAEEECWMRAREPGEGEGAGELPGGRQKSTLSKHAPFNS